MLNHKKTIIVGLCVAILLGTLTSKAFAQTEWEKYAGNPILDIGASGDWDGVSVFGSSVLFDGDDPDPAHRTKCGILVLIVHDTTELAMLRVRMV